MQAESYSLLFIRDDDRSSDLVCLWLKSLGKQFLAVSESDDISIREDSGQLYLYNLSNSQHGVPLRKVCSVFNFIGQIGHPFIVEVSSSIENQIKINTKNEIIKVLKSVLTNGMVQRNIGNVNFDNLSFNKLDQLQIAGQVGLKVPEYRLISTLESLHSCFNDWGRVITKNVDVSISIKTPGLESSAQRTIEITKNDTFHFPAHFGLTFVQKLIKSAFELRIIYLLGKTYSIAQVHNFEDERVVDMRDPKGFVRIVPFELPQDLNEKIEMLMHKLNLNYGAIDVIVGDDNEYYFLEVNPYGQFGFVSYYGNYYIEKAIAEYL